MVQRTVCHRVLADDGGQLFCKHFHGCPNRECERLIPIAQLSGELWLDADGNTNFKFHIQGGDFTPAKEALQKFIVCLQSKLDDEEKCPYYESIATQSN